MTVQDQLIDHAYRMDALDKRVRKIEDAIGAAEAVREACAKIAEDDDGNFTWAGTDKGVAIRQQVAADIAAAIRAMPLRVNSEGEKK